MDKPTVFFSHSSKDRELIIPIKNKIDEITGNTLKIFMSSDGQSIPFGHNWVHKIEEGLTSAQIMFIFVTPNSIKSEWIYFEAGFAYSKGIDVIPVGIGINVGQLKPPLNLLQGFDMTTAESMNNFISIINRKFDTTFKEDFDDQVFKVVNEFFLESDHKFDFSQVFEHATYECFSQYASSDNSSKIIRYNIEKFFIDIKEYLNKENIQYSNSKKEILVNGIKIRIEGEEKEPNGSFAIQDHKISLNLSTYNFQEVYDLALKLFSLFDHDKLIAFAFHINTGYAYVNKDEQISSIVATIKDIKHNSLSVGSYKYKDKINWWIRDYNRHAGLTTNYYKLGLSFKIGEVSYSDIVDFMNCIYVNGIIYKNS